MKVHQALVLFSLSVPAAAQYSGPALLSRGEAPAAMAVPNIRFRPYVEVSGIYDTGLANVGVTDQGQIANASAAGMGITWGVSGAHSWRHDRVGLDYRGDLLHYNSEAGYDSLDQTIMMSLEHQFTRHIAFSLHESAAVVSRDFGLTNLPQSVSFDPATAYVPATDYFDNRTAFINSRASLTVQKTARLSFNMSGDSLLVRRRSQSLTGTNGYTAAGDVQYRLSRRTTIGANYEYLHFDYTRLFGATDAHGAALTYAIRLSRRTEFSAYGGFLRVESKFIQDVPVDPVIASLLGISAAQQVVHRINYVPNAAARLSRTFRSGVVYAAGQRSVMPGNGLFVTSYSTTVSAGYSYTRLRNWSFGATIDRVSAYSAGTIAGRYSGAGGGATASRSLGRSFHAITSVRMRKYGSSDFEKYNRTIYDVRVGIGFSPGDVPLRVW